MKETKNINHKNQKDNKAVKEKKETLSFSERLVALRLNESKEKDFFIADG